MEQQRTSSRLEEPPPAWFTALGLSSGLVLVGGTVWLASAYGSLLRASPLSQPASELPVEPSATTLPEPLPTSPGLACNECEYDGTSCEAGQCRLAADVRWQLQATALVRRSVPSTAPLRICARVAGTAAWACSQASAQVLASPGGRWVTSFSRTGEALLATREDLEVRGLDVEVREGVAVVAATRAHVWSSIIAGKLLFQGGLSYPTPTGNAVFSLRPVRGG